VHSTIWGMVFSNTERISPVDVAQLRLSSDIGYTRMYVSKSIPERVSFVNNKFVSDEQFFAILRTGKYNNVAFLDILDNVSNMGYCFIYGK
jgi:hypothetical protein